MQTRLTGLGPPLERRRQANEVTEMVEAKEVARAKTAPPSLRYRHRAAVLFAIAAVLWWHQWVPALFVVGFVSWVGLHRQLEADLGNALARVWRRAWPPTTLVLIPLLSGSAFAYWVSDQPITPKVLPIALNMLGLAMVSCGAWRPWSRPATLAG